ncbi:unnamed protein product, partial [Prorocentrum cordatum]
MKGAKAGKEVHDALAELSSEAATGASCTSWGHALAFDMLHPHIVREAPDILGMPATIVKIIVSIWSNQRRLLLLGGRGHRRAQHVGASIPHGDPRSPMCPSAVLLGPLRGVTATSPYLSHQSYVDESTRESHSPHGIVGAAKLRRGWGDALGMRDNSRKDQWFHRDPRGRRRTAAHPDIGPDRVKDHLIVLGAKITGEPSTVVMGHRADVKYRRQQSALTAVARAQGSLIAVLGGGGDVPDPAIAAPSLARRGSPGTLQGQLSREMLG